MLKFLDLSDNDLTEIPDLLLDLTRLDELSLGGIRALLVRRQKSRLAEPSQYSPFSVPDVKARHGSGSRSYWSLAKAAWERHP